MPNDEPYQPMPKELSAGQRVALLLVARGSSAPLRDALDHIAWLEQRLAEVGGERDSAQAAYNSLARVPRMGEWGEHRYVPGDER